MKTIVSVLFFALFYSLVSTTVTATPVPQKSKQTLAIENAEAVLGEYTKFVENSGDKLSSKDRATLETVVGELKAEVDKAKAQDIEGAKARFEAAFARYVAALKKNAGLK
jgi:hypothetical protein